MADTVSARELQKNFGRYQDRALVAPVMVTKYGRASVVILSAAEYDRLKKLDRQELAVSELGKRDVAAIKTARIPAKHRYRSSDLR